MYHYQKNIGDYRSATMHLSLLEHGVYNQMLDWYYLDETPLPLDNRTLFRRLSAKSEIEQQAVLDVLREMFEENSAGWVHKRIEREIAQYKAKADQARSAGKLGGRPIKNGVGYIDNRDGLKKEPDAKPTANREPLTVNQSAPKGERAKALTFPIPDWINAEHWNAWHSSPKRRKASDAQKTVAIGKLSGWRDQGLDYAGALENAAAGGYQGLFLPDKPAARAGPNASRPKYAAAAAAIFDDEPISHPETIDV